jgi:hypothetical protein
VKNVLSGRRYSYLATFAAVIVVIIAGIVLLPGGLANNENNDHRDVDYNYVNERIETMMSNPDAMLFSCSWVYIEMGKNEYLDIYTLGEKALPFLERIINEEEAKGIQGLRYVLAGHIKDDIISQTNFFDLVP